MKKAPIFVYCAACKNCKRRKFKSLFDDKAMLDCCDINGISVKTIIPVILWAVDWCKLCKKK